ncbi:hypothetical protein LWI29_036956 [Acer saccharum]|uniref:Uncharacterized protein n=1 Tax=Acer saccharum TaxID=4024 RepID=A0AA39W568_ACESA|nr:hypothetical protein LWI29_036956 [Acer saccharum]
MGGGGGAAMRAAGKLTGMGVFNGVLRGGISAAQPAEQALRNVSRPAAAVVSTATSSVADVAAIQKALCVADWDFAAVEEDLRVESSPEPIARVVFDVPPTLQEAKDATADLKEAIFKVYGPAFGLPLLAISDNPEYGPDSKFASSVPNSVFNAFKLLCERPDVQSVVISLVNDKKMWDAAMENNDLKEFMESQRKSGDTAVEFGDTEDYKTGDTEDGKTGDTKGQANKFFQKVKKSVVYMMSNVSDIFGKTGYTKAQSNKFYQKVKKSVVDMVSNVPDIIQKFFGSSPAEGISADAGGAGAERTYEKTMGTYLMGLVIMVIMVVVLKRLKFVTLLPTIRNLSS